MNKKITKLLNSENGKLHALLQLIVFAFTRPGKKIIVESVKKKLSHSSTPPNYNKWIRKQLDIKKLNEEYNTTIKTLSFKPILSIFLATDKQDLSMVVDTVKSINEQLYTSWDLFIVGNYELGLYDLTEIKSNPKITLIQSDRRGLVASLNTAMHTATGEYCFFLMPDTIITPDCLFQFVKHLNNHSDDQLIYGDEDCINDSGAYTDHYFKPGWSPDTLLSHNYIGNTFLISKKLLYALNGLNENYRGALLYDLLLRASELTNNIGHVPKIISHQRPKLLNAFEDKEVKNVLEAALIRRRIPGIVEEIPGTDCWQINYSIIQPGLVSIIIPTKDQAGLLKKALNSIITKTTYTDYEILVINNNSTTPEFFSLMNEYKSLLPSKFRVIDAPGTFNFSRLINMGVAASLGKYLLLLNNDVEVTDACWLAQMIACAQNKKTGAVGVKLLYPDNTIQHAGIVLGIHGHSGHVFANQPADYSGYHNNINATTNYSALTAACLMCRKDVYMKAGGMDEILPVEFNDIDLCLKFLQLGYYNVYLPSVTLYHHESATRGHPLSNLKAWRQHEHDLAIFKSKWQSYIDNDPFYNPNLSFNETDFRIKTNLTPQ